MEHKGRGLNEHLSARIKVLQEALKDNPQKIAVENSDLQKRMFLLNQQYQKRSSELKMWYQLEKDKITIRHKQRLEALGVY